MNKFFWLICQGQKNLDKGCMFKKKSGQTVYVTENLDKGWVYVTIFLKNKNENPTFRRFLAYISDDILIFTIALVRYGSWA